MHVYKVSEGLFVRSEDRGFHVAGIDWDTWFAQDDLAAKTHDLIAGLEPTAPEPPPGILCPIGTQEIWACGVTYIRSRAARMEESKDAGGGDFYDRVYTAPRPELFFKSTAHRCVGPGGAVRIRTDSKWNVPEPELTLAVSATGSINGYTIGNDMSSRDIEGENPLYLPQAKTYDGSAALGPCVYLPDAPLPPETEIHLHIERAGAEVFAGHIAISQIKRTFEELVGFLTHSSSFPVGAYLMTGTGIIPEDDFTLASGDIIRITIDGIGTLINAVA